MTDERGISRRTFVKGAGATAGVAAVGMGSSRLEAGPVGTADAIAPLVIYGAALGSSVALGWMLREFEVIGADDPPEGLTPDALSDRIHQTARTRQSTNASTFVDNSNILDGVRHTAYAEGKIGAIDSLNQQNTESKVLEDGTASVDDYETTIKKNLLKSWNESVRELAALVSAIKSHADLSLADFFPDPFAGATSTYNHELTDVAFPVRTLTMPDGTSFDVDRIEFVSENGYVYDLIDDEAGSPTDYGYYYGSAHPAVNLTSGVVYLRKDEWNNVWTEISSTFDDVRDGLITWVEGVYADVQAGELDTAELLTPRELAELTSDDEDYNQAVADLMALNVSVNLEREAEIRLPEIGATVFGSLAVTGETTLSPGTVDPSADSLSYYLTYNVAEGEGTWNAYQTGIDGGVLTFTSEPFAETTFFVSTLAGESVEVTASDFTLDSSGTSDVWTADLSDSLETSITEVDSVEYFSDATETNYETVQLTAPFEIVAFRDSEGNEVESSEFTKTAPQDDTNYITQEEWAAQEQRYLELIEKYEESAGGGAGFAGLLEGEGGLAALAVLALAAFGIINR